MLGFDLMHYFGGDPKNQDGNPELSPLVFYHHDKHHPQSWGSLMHQKSEGIISAEEFCRAMEEIAYYQINLSQVASPSFIKPQNIQAQLEQNYYSHVKADYLERNHFLDLLWDGLESNWEVLAKDERYKDLWAQNRHRAISYEIYDPEDHTLTLVPSLPFQQPDNVLAPEPRFFVRAPIQSNLYHAPLVKFDLEQLGFWGQEKVIMIVQQYASFATAQTEGNPSPEGFHKDDYFIGGKKIQFPIFSVRNIKLEDINPDEGGTVLCEDHGEYDQRSSGEKLCYEDLKPITTIRPQPHEVVYFNNPKTIHGSQKITQGARYFEVRNYIFGEDLLSCFKEEWPVLKSIHSHPGLSHSL